VRVGSETMLLEVVFLGYVREDKIRLEGDTKAVETPVFGMHRGLTA
jgi:hypothetical protein